ncbi:hypothetical protein Sjap_008866 [Stephania japonica]|uniref:Uncharacterized protein n=1 Tax=Stephania japonica TaxID=461633 RepID=A0AAP0JST1_9MAGN
MLQARWRKLDGTFQFMTPTDSQALQGDKGTKKSLRYRLYFITPPNFQLLKTSEAPHVWNGFQSMTPFYYQFTKRRAAIGNHHHLILFSESLEFVALPYMNNIQLVVVPQQQPFWEEFKIFTFCYVERSERGERGCY